jgi:integrating conjugative element protein (TIGR03756 family)
MENSAGRDKMKKIAIMALLLLSSQVSAFEAKSTTITTAQIFSSVSTDKSCLNYCFTGICVWLKCVLFACSIETSIRVRHYNPDLVVSVYDEPGDNPWKEMRSVYGNFENSLTDRFVRFFHPAFAGGGHQTEGGDPAIDKSLRFKEATAIGHPYTLVSEALSDTGLYCPSEATAFYPHFSSGLDAWTWRLGLAENFYFFNFLPGRRVVGSGFYQEWGSVFPRTGFIMQKDDVKAAAVIAQRVGNIVTQTGEPHVYSALDGNNYSRTWLPGELLENDRNTGVWQMLAPKQDKKCYVFGANDVYSKPWSHGRTSEDNRYAFALWRPYQCCEKKGAWLFDIPFKACLQ